METVIKSSRLRWRRKKKQKELKLLKREFKSSSLHLNTSKLGIKKLKKLMDQYPSPLIQHLYEQHISLNTNGSKGFKECRNWDGSIFERRINFSDSESSAGNSESSILVVPSSEVQLKDHVVIDLSDDFPDQNEVIDLTESSSMVKSCNSRNSKVEPTVIDITQDDLKDQPKSKLENDEVFVIGTFSKNYNLTKKHKNPSFIPLSNRWNNFDNLITYNRKLKRNCLFKRSVLEKIDKNNLNQFRNDLVRAKENFTKVGENVYVNSPVTFPSNGLRPIIIDGSNVAFVHSDHNFSCKRLEICINYFKEKGHKVTAFVPQFRVQSHRSDDPQILMRLERQGDVVLTPSKKVDGRNIVPYDDRFIVQIAVLKGGIIVTRDNYNDLLKENPAWAETIKYRTLAFTWVDDVLIFPKDPLGEHGPSLEEFLRFH